MFAKADERSTAIKYRVPGIPLRPAAMLRGSRYKAEMTQKELADALGIRQHHLSEMEHGKRAIGKQMAKRLAEVLECDWRVFL